MFWVWSPKNLTAVLTVMYKIHTVPVQDYPELYRKKIHSICIVAVVPKSQTAEAMWVVGFLVGMSHKTKEQWLRSFGHIFLGNGPI